LGDGEFGGVEKYLLRAFEVGMVNVNASGATCRSFNREIDQI